MSSYFSTDWGALTASDWGGLLVTIFVFLGMFITFYLTLRPSKREELEKQKYKMLEDD